MQSQTCDSSCIKADQCVCISDIPHSTLLPQLAQQPSSPHPTTHNARLLRLVRLCSPARRISPAHRQLDLRSSHQPHFLP